MYFKLNAIITNENGVKSNFADIPAGVDYVVGAYNLDEGFCFVEVIRGEELVTDFIEKITKEVYDAQTDVCSDCE